MVKALKVTLKKISIGLNNLNIIIDSQNASYNKEGLGYRNLKMASILKFLVFNPQLGSFR